MSFSTAKESTNSERGFRVYKLPGVEKTIVARKGGPTIEQIRSSDSYSTLRKNQLEFGVASKVSKQIRDSFPKDFRELFEPYVSAKLTAKLRKVIQKGAGETGRRPFHLSQNKKRIKGFSFSGGATFEEIFKPKFFLRDGAFKGQSIIHFPSFIPENEIDYPNGATHFRVLGHAISISDQEFASSDGQYRMITPGENGKFETLKGELRPLWKMPLEPITEQLSLKSDEGEWSDSVSVLVILGIRFYKFEDLHYREMSEKAALSIYKVI
jgi:hypothetical protein